MSSLSSQMSSPRKNPDTATAVRPEQPVPAAARCGRSSWQIRCAAVVLLPVPGGPGWGFPVFTQGIWGKSCRKPWYSIKKKHGFKLRCSLQPIQWCMCGSAYPMFLLFLWLRIVQDDTTQTQSPTEGGSVTANGFRLLLQFTGCFQVSIQLTK